MKILPMLGLATALVFALGPFTSPPNLTNAFGPKYSFFASYSSNGLAIYGTQVNLKTGIEGLDLGLLYLGVNNQSYTGFDLNFKKSFGNSGLFLKIRFLYPVSSKGMPTKGRFTGLTTEP